MLEIEFELAEHVGVIDVGQPAAFLDHLLIKRSAGCGRVEDELMEVGVVG